LALQTTLLTAAIAIILALVAALVGPLLIDWGTYRPLIESEASRLIGLPVNVKGAIDARLLPSPQFTLRDIEIGGASADKATARALDVELALGPLLRGEWRATELRLTGPQLHLGLDAAGHLTAPSAAIAFKPDALAIDRLSIVNGTITLTDAASTRSVTLDQFYFDGEASSLLGPFRGEGDVVIGDEHYPYRVASGRYADDNTLALRVNVDPRDQPFNLEVKGTLAFEANAPRFEGELAVTRPAAAPAVPVVSQPWQLYTKIKASAASALLENIEVRYGSEEHGIKLTGVANLKFGKAPRFDGVLSGRQIDLDGVLGSDGGHSSPGAAVRRLVEWVRGAFRPGMPMQIGIGIDQVTLAGGAVQNVRGDISADANGWDLKSFEFRAPGFTQARLSGHLAVGDNGVSFSGPAEIDSADPKALAAWLEGRAQAAQDAPQSLRLRGELTLGSEKIAVEHLTADFARRTIAGRFVYLFAANGHPSKLEAALNAPEFDFDAALGVGRALLAGSRLERPHDMEISADIDRATLAGVAARNVSARVKVDADRWQIDRLIVGDLGGAALTASGTMVLAGPAPQGDLRLDVDARDLTSAAALLAHFAPWTAQKLNRAVPAMAPAKLRGQLSITPSGSSAEAKLSIEGSLGKLRVALNGDGRVEPKPLRVGVLHLDGKLTADDANALVAVLGLNSVVAVNAGPGALTLSVSGPPHGEWQVDGRLTAGGLSAKAAGTVNLFADAPTAALRTTMNADNAAPLRGPGIAEPVLPVTFAARIGLSAKEFSVSDLNATVAASTLRGRLTASIAQPHLVGGEIEADSIDAPALVAAAVGMPPRVGRKDAAWAWPDAPFGDGLFGDFAGTVRIKARRLDIWPRLSAREFRTNLRLGKNEFAFDDMTGVVSGGQFSGSIKFHDSGRGLDMATKIALSRAGIAALLPAAARPPIAGLLDLSLDFNGSGLSPVALVGSLHGSGKIALNGAEFAGLNPRAFDAVGRAVDQGLTVDASRVSEVVRKTLDSGPLAVKHAQATLTMDAGQLRLSEFAAETKDVGLSLIGNLDLLDGTLDAHLVLSPKSGPAGADVFLGLNGPVTAPTRSVDVTALTGWLTLRAVDNEARRLKAMEEAPPSQLAPAPAPSRVPPLTPPLIAMPPPQAAPALPAPIYVNPLPVPRGPTPEASIGPQR
jgi:large subunit ribosomal protein L24